MVGLELRQQHPHDLFSGRDIPQAAAVSGLYNIPAQDNNHSGVVAVTPSQPGSIL